MIVRIEICAALDKKKSKETQKIGRRKAEKARDLVHDIQRNEITTAPLELIPSRQSIVQPRDTSQIS